MYKIYYYSFSDVQDAFDIHRLTEHQKYRILKAAKDFEVIDGDAYKSIVCVVKIKNNDEDKTPQF